MLGLVNWDLFKVGSNLSDWENFYNPQGVFSISGHGVTGGINDGTQPGGFGEGPTLTGDQFLTQLQQNGYVIGSGVPIVLHSCNTGQGQNSFAQWLANAVNAPVIAPDNYLSVGFSDADGVMQETNNVINGGHFWQFNPNGVAAQQLGNSY